MPKVKLVAQKGNVALVEAVSVERGLVRVYVPYDALNGEYIEEWLLESGIEYGVPWCRLLSEIMPGDKAAALARILHEAGIFTAEDARTKPNIVMAALQRMWQIDASRITKMAIGYSKGGLK